MSRNPLPSIGIATALLPIRGATAFSAQVPNGLALSECQGCDSSQLVSISQNGPVVAAILGNPAMIGAFHAHTVVKARDYVFTEYGQRRHALIEQESRP